MCFHPWVEQQLLITLCVGQDIYDCHRGVEQNGHSDLDSSAPEGLCDPGRAHRVKNRLLVGQQNWGLDAWNMKRCDTSILKIILLAVDWPFILSKFHFFVD